MRSVVVIGGGFAGVAAATALAETGVRVILLESRGHLGGRASSSPPDARFPAPADNGPHLFMGCYEETRKLFKRLGAEEEIDWIDPLSLAFYLPGGRRAGLKVGRWPAPFHVLAAMLSTDLFPWREKPSLFRAFFLFRKRPFPDWTITGCVGEFLDRTGQGPASRERFWNPFCRSVMNAPPSSAPLKGFGEVLHRMFFGRRHDSALGISKKPLSDVLFPRIPDWLERRGGVVRLNTAVRGLERTTSKTGPVLRVLTRTDERFEGDAVIWSIAPHHFPAYGPPDSWPQSEGFPGFGKSPILSVNLISDRVLLKQPMAGLPGSRFEWVFNRNRNWDWRSQDGRHQYLSLVASACSDLLGLSDEQLVGRSVHDLQEHLGAKDPIRVLHSKVVRELTATIDWNPGTDLKRPSVNTSDPRVFLAGDWTATGLPATVESAVLSGKRASESALASIGRVETS